MTEIHRDIKQQSLEHACMRGSCPWRFPGAKSEQYLYISMCRVFSPGGISPFMWVHEGVRYERPRPGTILIQEV